MNRVQHGLLTGLGLLALLASATSMVLTRHNGTLRTQVAERQQYVQQTAQLEGLYRDMVRTLAELAARQQDDQLRALLQRHGITYDITPPPASAAPARK